MNTPNGIQKISQEEKIGFFTSVFQDSALPKSISSIKTKRYAFVNPAWEKFTGFTSKEAFGKTAAELNLISIEEGLAIIDLVLIKKEISNYKSTICLKNGQQKPVMLSFDTITINDEGYVLNTISDLKQDTLSKRKYEKVLIKRTEDLIVAQDFISNSIENMSDGFVALNNHWEYTYVNKKASEILGKSTTDLIGKNIWEVFPEGVGKTFYHYYHKAKETQQSQCFEEYFQPWDRWFENRVVPSLDGISVFFQDVTKKIKTQQELNISKEYAENLIKSLKQGVIVVNHNLEIIDVNPSICNMLGYDRNELIGLKSPFPYWSSQSKKDIKQVVTQTLKGVSGNHEFVFIKKNGDHFPVAVSTSVVINKKEGFKTIIVTVEDITKRKKAEELLIKSKNSLDNFIDNLGDPLFVKDNESKLLLVNEAFCKIFNLEKKDIIGKTLAENVPEEERESFLAIDKEVLKTGKENINEETLTIQGRGTKIISTKKTRFVDDEGHKYVIGIIRDITQRKKAEQILKESQEQFSKVFHSSSVAFSIMDMNQVTVEINEAMAKLVNSTREQLIGKTVEEANVVIMDDEYHEQNNRLLEKMTKQGFLKNEVMSKTLINGEKTYSLVSVEFIELSGMPHILTSAIDITEKKKLELELQKSEKSLTEAQKLAKVGSYNLNLETQIAETSSSFKEIVGVSVDTKITFELWRTITHPDDTPKNQKVLDECIKTGKKFDLEYRILTKNTKQLKWIHGLGEVAYKNGKPINFFGTIQDITRRKLNENKIEETNKQLIEANKELNILRNQLERENVYLRDELDLVFNFEEMVYGSVEFSNVLTEIEKVAPTNATVLVLGESGTGKELLARAIHNISPRSNKPLIKVNCSAIPRELIESELFGHKKGSFTGAFSDKIGKFELANGGTLFLDEIGELPIDMQPKILRFLQEGEIEVVGGTSLKKLDVRVIAATNRNLLEEIEAKRFREDLYFRLHVFPIEVPPLRKRTDDIPLLVEHFVDKFNKAYSKNIKFLSEDAMQKLKAYHWPGNIRELENLIERASILSTSETLIVPGFESESQVLRINQDKNLSLDAVQRNHIYQVLEHCNWKISGPNGAAILLGLKPSTLRDKMAKLHISKPI